MQPGKKTRARQRTGGSGEGVASRWRRWTMIFDLDRTRIGASLNQGVIETSGAFCPGAKVIGGEAPLFGAIPHGDQSRLVSECVEGVALSQLVGELRPDIICAIAKGLMSALRCLECLSLVHGDLSPNKVIIDLNGQVRLLDFESCSRVGEALSSNATIGFSAPERHVKRAGLPSVDAWSVGAILIWLVTKRTPEIVVDDNRQPVSVSIGTAAPAADMLGDVINIAAAATRLDPSLRPCAADLEDRLSRSYRWLEPINRSVLSAIVSSKLASDREDVAVNSELDVDKPGRAKRLGTLLILPALCLL